MNKLSKIWMNLPEEVVPAILIKLPVKSLLRFRCVCKSWNSLITNSRFILSHLHHNRISSQSISLLKRTVYKPNHEEIYSLHDAENEQFHQIETLDAPTLDDANMRIVGVVNGLICLCSTRVFYSETYPVMLWNPSIKKCLTLPSSGEQSIVYKFCFGFGYEAGSDDFRVVRIVRIIRQDCVETLAEVFSLRARSWKTLDSSPPIKDPIGHSINLGNNVYVLSREPRQVGFYIMCFDLSAEVFTEDLPCPQVLVHNSFGIFPKLTIFCDSIAVISMGYCDKYHISIIRGEGVAKSFEKFVSLDINGDVSLLHIAGFITKEKLVVVEDGSIIVSPSAEDVQVVKYVPPGPQFELERIEVHLYKESLVLLKEGDHLSLFEDSEQSRECILY